MSMHNIIIILGALVILDIGQNIIRLFLVWTVSPKFSSSKILCYVYLFCQEGVY